MRNFYKEGDHLVICDVSGQKALRSECVKQWNGLIVIKEYAEARHPLDTQTPPKPERTISDARPEGETIFLAPGDVTREML